MTSTSTDLITIKVDDLMTSAVVTLDPATNIGRARELMLGLGIHGLPVVDELGHVVGFVTSSDLVEEWAYGEPVETIMSRDIHGIEVGTPIAEVAADMVAHKVHHLLVTRNEQPVGVVTSFDLVKALARLAAPGRD